MIDLDHWRRDWFARVRFLPRHDHLTFTAEGVKLGHGTPIAYSDPEYRRQGRCELVLHGPFGKRALTLLSAAHGRLVDDSFLDVLESAAASWNAGDNSLAMIKLALTGFLTPPADPEHPHFHLYMADQLLRHGIETDDLLKGFGLLGADERAWATPSIAKAPFVPSLHPRWDAGATQGHGGSFRVNDGVVPVAARDQTPAKWVSPNGGFMPEVPAYKQDVKPVTSNWRAYAAIIKADPSISPKQAYVLSGVFAGEGGLQKAKGPNATAVAGILQDTLDQALDAGVVPKKNGVLPEKTTDLSLEQILAVKKWYLQTKFNGSGKIDGFAAINDFKDAHSAGAVMDTIFREGDSGGGALIRSAMIKIRDDMPPAERQRFGLQDKPDRIGVIRRTLFDSILNYVNASPENGEKFRAELTDERNKRRPREYHRNDFWR